MSRKNKLVIGIALTAVLFSAGCKYLPSRGAVKEKPQPIQLSAAGVDAAEPVIAAAPDGSFYVAWVNHDAKEADVMLARFNDAGERQGSPVRVNREAGAATAWRGDQPSIAVAPDGVVHVLWTARIENGEKHGTTIYLSSSTDRGQSFATQVKVNDDDITEVHGKHSLVVDHGMHSLAVAADGRIYAAWLDERNVEAPKPSAKAEGHHMESNRDVYVAYSTDGGRSFSANKKVASDACPCCKTALTVSPDGTLYAGWRQVLPGSFRHIAVAGSNDGGKNFSTPVIVSDDRWVLQGCPVSGPALSVDRASGNLKVVWYAAGEGSAAGVYFAESKDKGHTFTPRELLSPETVRGTPALAGPIALWQTSETAETKMRSLGNAGTALSVAANAELPAGTYVNDKLFVAYIGKEKEKRSIWLIRAAL